MDYRKGGIVNERLVSFFYSRESYVYRLILATGMVARSVHCLLSKTDIFACKVAERQPRKKGVVKY